MTANTGISIERKFNLVKEKWIPATSRGLVSLENIFKDFSIISLGGNPVQKISMMKLLLAISQAAFTPKNNEEWFELSNKSLGEKVLAYLDKHKDDFWLYGEKPFLQIPAIKKARKISCSAALPHISTGNSKILTQKNNSIKLTDAEKAMIVLQLSGFGFSGKKTDNTVVISPGYNKKTKDNNKPTSGKPGTSLGFLGHLHAFLHAENLISTIRHNLLTHEDVMDMKIFSKGMGTPSWEMPPGGEDCRVARNLKETLMGRLVPYNRFVLLDGDEMHYSEGILHDDYKAGMFDPSMAIDYSKNPYKTLWADPEKRPWRNLSVLLSFLDSNGNAGMNCFQLKCGFKRLKNEEYIGVWVGGIKVSNNAGEQYVSGSDDYVESNVLLKPKNIDSNEFLRLKQEMEILEDLSRHLYATICGYYKSLKKEGSDTAKLATNIYWQLMEESFQKLVYSCYDNNEEKIKKLHSMFSSIVNNTYDQFCPADTPNQIDAWANNKPKAEYFLAGKNQKKGKTPNDINNSTTKENDQ